VCSPNCDSSSTCPPNFFCSNQVFPESIAPNPFCLPGFVGFPCRSDLDCMSGTCDTIDDTHVCATACSQSSDCSPYDFGDFNFACIGGRCLSKSSFFLRFCFQDGDCSDPALRCTASGNGKAGLCFRPCTSTNDCPQSADIPQTCVDLGLGNLVPHVCLPGFFGNLCNADSGCVAGLQCDQLVTFLAYKICTIACETHAECANNPLIGSQAYCQAVTSPAQPHICVEKQEGNKSCVSDVQCKSNHCTNPTSNGFCACIDNSQCPGDKPRCVCDGACGPDNPGVCQ
jgi:hypothetical protein